MVVTTLVIALIVTAPIVMEEDMAVFPPTVLEAILWGVMG